MEDTWLAHAKRIQAIASTGLHYADNIHDQARYEELRALAQDMLAQLWDVPLARIADLAPDASKGYATPMIDVRAAVIKEGRILLVQERVDGRWSLPGGFADIGLSASENTVKEVEEEAGIPVTARHLFLLRHKAKHPYPPDIRDFYKLFFLCDRVDDAAPSPGPETLDARFFDPSDLPDLSLGRTLPNDIRAAVDAAANPGKTVFD